MVYWGLLSDTARQSCDDGQGPPGPTPIFRDQVRLDRPNQSFAAVLTGTGAEKSDEKSTEGIAPEMVSDWVESGGERTCHFLTLAERVSH